MGDQDLHVNDLRRRELWHQQSRSSSEPIPDFILRLNAREMELPLNAIGEINNTPNDTLIVGEVHSTEEEMNSLSMGEVEQDLDMLSMEEIRVEPLRIGVEEESRDTQLGKGKRVHKSSQNVNFCYGDWIFSVKENSDRKKAKKLNINLSKDQVIVKRKRRRRIGMSDSEIAQQDRRHLKKNLTPKQILAQQQRHLLENMTPDQILRQQQLRLVENMTPDQIEAQQQRHLLENMTPDQILRQQELRFFASPPLPLNSKRRGKKLVLFS